MPLSLYEHQKLAINQLKSGSILCGGVGSGKSRTALAYYYLKECNGSLNESGNLEKMKNPKDLYIITTATKRDSLDWEMEAIVFNLSTNPERNKSEKKLVIDSWNNIGKYVNVCNSFFIFDEQRVVGSGAWVKAFWQIAKKNNWILLSATPGDTWMDYIPVFVANGFYRNRTEFIRRHVIFNRYTKYPKVDRYVDVKRLIALKKSILVNMDYVKKTERHYEYVDVGYNKTKYDFVLNQRWNIYKDKPCKNISELCSVLRKVVNSDNDRIKAIRELIFTYPRTIVFYNFDYELEILRSVCEELQINYAELNGHKHMPVPEKGNWCYLVNYGSGAEAWNCVETNVVIFYSQNYSYKMMEQSCGRIDRLNTPYSDLYYYILLSNSPLDRAIKKCLDNKQKFNEDKYMSNIL